MPLSFAPQALQASVTLELFGKGFPDGRVKVRVGVGEASGGENAIG